MARVYQDLVGSERKYVLYSSICTQASILTPSTIRLNALVEFFRTDEANDSDSIVDLQR